MTTTSATKTKALCVATRCADVEQFVATYHKFCDDTSFFVATHNSRPIGLETAFSIQLADSTPVLRGLCVVVEAWTTSSNPFNRPGIRLGIRRLTADSVDVFTRLVRAARDTPRDEASAPISAPTPPPVPAVPDRPPPLVRAEPVDVPLPPPTPSILAAAAAPASEAAAAPAPPVTAASPLEIPAREPSAPAAANLPQASRAPAPEDEPTLTTAPASPSPASGPPRSRAATPPPVPGSLPPRNVKPPPATPAVHSLPPSPPLQPLRSGSSGTSTPSRGVLSIAAPKAALGSSVPRPGGVVSSPAASSPPPLPSPATSPTAATVPASTPTSSADLEAAWDSAGPPAPGSPAAEPFAPPPGLIPTPPVLPRFGRAETPLPSTPTLIPRPRPISEPTDPDLASSLSGPPPFSMQPAQADPEAPASSQETADKLAGLSKISSVTPLSATAFAAALSSNTSRAGDRPPDERAPGPAVPPPPPETADPTRTGTRRQTPAFATPAVARRTPSEPVVAAKPAASARRTPSEPTAVARSTPSDSAADAEARTPGSDFVLPANPLSNLTDDQLEGFIDCTLYEEAGSFNANESSIDIRDLMPATRDRPPPGEPFAYTDVRRPFRSSTGQFIPIEPDSQVPGARATPPHAFTAESRRRDTPPSVELLQRRRATPPPVSMSPTVEVELDAFAAEPGVTHATAANVRQSALAMQAAESRQSAPAVPALTLMGGMPGMPGGDAMSHGMPPAGMANGMTTPFPGSIVVAPVYLPPPGYGMPAPARPSWQRWAVIGFSAMVALVLLVVVIKLASRPGAPEGGAPATDGKTVAGTPAPKQDRPDERGPDRPGAGAVTSGSAGSAGSATAGGTASVGSPPGAGSSIAGVGPGSAGPGPGSAGPGPGSAALTTGPGSASAGSGRAPDQPGGPSVAGGSPVVGSGPCRISITANLPGAAVKVDGQSVGVSPVTLDGPCQSRKVEISHPRYTTVTRVVTPAPDKPESLEITLPRPMHYLNVISTPPGATISIDGRRLGTSPAIIHVPGFTIVRITIEKAGYKTVTQRYYSKVPQDRLTVRMLESFGFGGK